MSRAVRRLGALLALTLVLALLGWGWAVSRVQCFEDGSCRAGLASWCTAGEVCEVDAYPDGRPW